MEGKSLAAQTVYHIHSAVAELAVRPLQVNH